MSGAIPIAFKASDPEEKILCVADLKREGSKKLSKVARGEWNSLVYLMLQKVRVTILHEKLHLLSSYDVINLF
jgi:hypothetical protein